MYEFLLIANFAVWLSLAFFYVRQPFASAFHPASAYLLFHFVVFLFRPALAWFRDYDAIYRTYHFVPAMEDKILVQMATILGLLCFVLAAMRYGNAPPRFPQDAFDSLERRALVPPYRWATCILLPCGLLSALALWDTRATGSSTMVLDAVTGHTINTSGNGYFDNLQFFLGPLAVMFVWFYRFRWWSLLPLLAFVLVRAGTGGRAAFVLACTSAALLYLYQQRRRWPDLRAAAITTLGLAFFAQVGEDRGAAVRSLFVEDRSLVGTTLGRAGDLRFMEGMDFANLEYFEFLVYAVPQRTGTYGYFLDNLQLLTQPIPRVLWESKPIGPPVQLFSLFDYGYPIGMTYSLPGNGWLQLGFIGVALWCGLFGWLFGKIHNRFQQSRHENAAVLAYMIFLPLSIQFFRDGLLLVLVQTAFFCLFPVWLVQQLARRSAVWTAEELRCRAFRGQRSGYAAP